MKTNWRQSGGLELKWMGRSNGSTLHLARLPIAGG